MRHMELSNGSGENFWGAEVWRRGVELASSLAAGRLVKEAASAGD